MKTPRSMHPSARRLPVCSADLVWPSADLDGCTGHGRPRFRWLFRIDNGQRDCGRHTRTEWRSRQCGGATDEPMEAEPSSDGEAATPTGAIAGAAQNSNEPLGVPEDVDEPLDDPQSNEFDADDAVDDDSESEGTLDETADDVDFEDDIDDEFDIEDDDVVDNADDESHTADDFDDVEAPTANTPVNLPQVCVQSGVPPVGCECANEPGFTTYTFQHAGEQRCMTSYVDPQATNEPLPLIIRPNCYTANRLEGPDIEMANLYGYHYLDLTSPDGGWAFPLNNEVNDSNYHRQCEDAATKDIGYLKGVFKIVDQMIADGLVDPDKVFVSGFSQNSVFAIFIGTCFPDRIAGVWQVGSGIYSQNDGARALPKCEGACTASAFIEHGAECRDIEPCETCQYFPVFPERTGDPLKTCIAMYDDDGAAHSTAVPAYRLLKAQGHVPTLMIFGSDPTIQLGGHDAPLNPMAWEASCLGLQDPCTRRCSDNVLTCMAQFRQEFRDESGRRFTMNNPDHRGFATQQYNQCLRENRQSCARGCAATRDMLTLLETPACECDVNTATCDCQTSNEPGACESSR